MRQEKRLSKYGSDEWVRKVMNNPAIGNDRLMQMAEELRRCGHLRALCLIHKELRLRMKLKEQ